MSCPSVVFVELTFHVSFLLSIPNRLKHSQRTKRFEHLLLINAVLNQHLKKAYLFYMFFPLKSCCFIFIFFTEKVVSRNEACHPVHLFKVTWPFFLFSISCPFNFFRWPAHISAPCPFNRPDQKRKSWTLKYLHIKSTEKPRGDKEMYNKVLWLIESVTCSTCHSLRTTILKSYHVCHLVLIVIHEINNLTFDHNY